MSERDAFGREKGEDTLAEMGWSSSVAPVPAPTPTPSPTPAPTATPPAPKPVLQAGEPLASGPAWTPGPRASATRRRRRGGVIVPLLVIGTFALGIGGAVDVFRAGSDALDDFTASIEDATQGGDSAAKAKTGPSLLQPAALKAALAKLPDGHIELLRVSPESINANVIVDGRMHIATVTAGGDVTDIKTSSRGTGASVKVNSAAPGRIARTAAKRAGRRVGSVSYLVLLHVLGKDRWELYFGDRVHFSASASGKTVKRVG